MNRFKVMVMALVAVLLVSMAPAQADPTAQQIWAKVVQRIKSTKDYTLSYNYSGSRGEYQFEYAVVRPDEVKTKIVKGDNAGAILIYNPNEYGNEVRARKGMLGKGIALNDKTVAGTPVIQPVFDMLLEKTRNGTAVLTGSDTVMGHAVWVLTVTANGVANTVGVDKASYDVLHWKYTDAEGNQDRTFYNIQTNVHPRISF